MNLKYSPYSHSKMSTYTQCPHKFRLQYIDKIKTPFTKNKALYKGVYIHAVIENNYDYNTVCEVNQIFTEEDRLETIEIIKVFEESEIGKYYHSKNGEHETEFGFKKSENKLVTCSYYDKQAWERGKIDYSFINKYNELVLVDWKSGKVPLPEYRTDAQTKLYAIWGFLNYPDINTILSTFVYVEHSEEIKYTYNRTDFQKLVKELYNKTQYCEKDTEYKKKTGPLCNYCDFSTYNFCNAEDELFTVSF